MEIEGKIRYNVGNMFDDVGKMRNDAEKLSNNVGKDDTTTWGELLEECATFLEKYSLS